MSKEKKPKRNWLEIIKNLVGILAGVATIAYRVYQFLKG